MFNKCFNDRELTAHNAKREVHEAQNLNNGKKISDASNEFVREAAYEIQSFLSKMKRGAQVIMPNPEKRSLKFRECSESLYVTSSDKVGLYTANRVTDTWYSGNAQYNFLEHKPKSKHSTYQSDLFTRMVWTDT